MKDPVISASVGVVLATLAVSFVSCGKYSYSALKEQHTGLAQVQTMDHFNGRYAIDAKTNLCFYVAHNAYDVMITNVPCTPEVMTQIDENKRTGR